MLLDKVNLQILDILAENYLTPFVEITKKICVYDATVHVRVRRLITEGIINKFTLSINNDRPGYDHLAFVGINVKPRFTLKVWTHLRDIIEKAQLMIPLKTNKEEQIVSLKNDGSDNVTVC